MNANFLTILLSWFYDLYKDAKVSKLWVSVCVRRDSVGRLLPHSVLSYSNVFMSIALRRVLGCVWSPHVSQHWWSEGASGHGWATHLKIYFLWYVLHFKSVIKCTLIIICYNPQGSEGKWPQVSCGEPVLTSEKDFCLLLWRVCSLTCHVLTHVELRRFCKNKPELNPWKWPLIFSCACLLLKHMEWTIYTYTPFKLIKDKDKWEL